MRLIRILAVALVAQLSMLSIVFLIRGYPLADSILVGLTFGYHDLPKHFALQMQYDLLAVWTAR